MIKPFKRVKDKVAHFLQKTPQLRDNDRKLLANIWYTELEDKNIPVREFLTNFGNGKYTNSESVRRMRAKLQSDNIELRGKRYGQRQVIADDVTQNIASV